MLSSNSSGGSNTYLPLPTYLYLLSSNSNGGSNTYLPLPTYICMHTYAIALAIKQAVIGRLPFWTLSTFFTDRGGGEQSANMIRPGSQATMVHLWALLCYHGMA